jgi:hypothetical protein
MESSILFAQLNAVGDTLTKVPEIDPQIYPRRFMVASADWRLQMMVGHGQRFKYSSHAAPAPDASARL